MEGKRGIRGDNLNENFVRNFMSREVGKGCCEKKKNGFVRHVSVAEFISLTDERLALVFEKKGLFLVSHNDLLYFFCLLYRYRNINYYYIASERKSQCEEKRSRLIFFLCC